MSKFAVFDIDGTLFRSGLYREVVYELISMGTLPKSILDDLADKEMAWRKRTHGNAFREFDQAMVDSLEGVITDLKIKDYDTAVNQVIGKHRDNVYVYTRRLVRSLKAEGRYMIAISGSQTELVEPFAKYYGFDYWVGAEYEREAGYFTGKAIKTHRDKHVILQNIISEQNLDHADSIAVGDSSGDVSMLEMVEKPIAFNPDDKLSRVAHKNGWQIVLERKNVMYQLTFNPKTGIHELANISFH